MKLKDYSETDKEIIVYNHYLNQLPEDSLVTVNTDIDDDSYKFIKDTADRLGVHVDAVIGTALLGYLEKNPKIKKTKKKKKK